jgi:uncharacterized membrane protein HdeD (DUF308 family)
MPERQDKTKQGEVKWWVPAIIGIILLIVPGGAFTAPFFFIVSIIMKVRSKKGSKTSPSLLFQFP